MIHPRTLNALEYHKVIHYLADLCVTSPGRETMFALKPLENRKEAEYAFTCYEEYRVWSEYPDNINYTLSAFPDVKGVLDVAGAASLSRKGSALDLDAFWALRDMLAKAWTAHKAINLPAAENLWPNLLNLVQNYPIPETLISALNRCISDDGFLKDDSSPELLRIRSEIRSLHQNCMYKVKDFAQKYNIQHYLQDEFMTLASDRYVLPLKANFKGRLQGIVHDWSQTGETLYFEPIFLVEINNRLAGLKKEEREEERAILTYLTALLIDNLPFVKAAYQLLGFLDFLNAKKLFAAYLDASVITFTDSEAGINLSQARHPLIAIAAQANALEKGKTAIKAYPLDIILKPGQRALVITGGNAGGKTVCLKTLGLNTALAMSGLPVTVAKGSHLPWFERLDAFIGDEQSLDERVSTFTAQIEHLAKAWKHLNYLGLVLLDEFGAGTDPAEGAALAQAVLDGLLEKNCFAFCATHFPALKSYALTHEEVSAASMLFDPETGKPLYKLAYGQVGASHALEVAKTYGLPESIIQRAKHYLLQDGEDTAGILQRLNDLAAKRENELEELKNEKSRTRKILEEKRVKLDQQKTALQSEVKNKITELMRAWQKERLSAKQALKEMNTLKRSLLPEKEQPASVLPEITVFTVGMPVFHITFNRPGIVTEVDERKNRARIDMEGVSLWANFQDLRQPAQHNKVSAAPLLKTSSPAISLSLDLRGQRTEEALANTEVFLDKALMRGFSEVEIIHGRGTGVLRKQIHSLLRTFPGVTAYSTAPEDRGGDGMTIVTLK